MPGPEQVFFSGITSLPLKDWEQGRSFVMADDRALLVFETLSPSLYPDTASLKGKEIDFMGVSSTVSPDGSLTLCLLFTDGEREFIYNTGKSFDSAMESFTNTDLPMLIDMDMVAQANNLLKGKRLWTRSNLWYDKDERRINGKKYYPVTVVDVTPGNIAFPLKLEMTTDNGEDFFMFMNFGNADNESRAFHNLFSLTDIRKQYPTVQPELWDLISSGKIKEGMTKLECRLALGNPIDISSGHDYSQTLDIWKYDNGVILWFEDGRLVRFRG